MAFPPQDGNDAEQVGYWKCGTPVNVICDEKCDRCIFFPNTEKGIATAVLQATQALNRLIDKARRHGMSVEITVFHTELIGSVPADGVRANISRRIL